MVVCTITLHRVGKVEVKIKTEMQVKVRAYYGLDESLTKAALTECGFLRIMADSS
jgi:hypothetical protein